MTGRFDYAKVSAIARERWGLRWPLEVRRVTRKLQPNGLHTVRAGNAGRHVVVGNRREGYRHYIRLTNHWSTEEMLRTLAHELEHARQCEALGADTMGLLYSNFGPSCQRLGWTRKRNAARHAEGLERHAEAAEERWELLLPAITTGGRIE